jgi:hypothetical protein
MRECEGNGRAWIEEGKWERAGKNGGVCTGKEGSVGKRADKKR